MLFISLQLSNKRHSVFGISEDFCAAGIFINPMKIPRNRRHYFVGERQPSIANKIFIRFNRAALFSRTAAVRARYFHLV